MCARFCPTGALGYLGWSEALGTGLPQDLDNMEGLAVGDVVHRVNGEPVAAEDLHPIADLLRRSPDFQHDDALADEIGFPLVVRPSYVLGGRANGLFTVGVTWGVGSVEELQTAGADVILRNPDRLKQPPEAALREAAAVAAFYSELRQDRWVTVQWTQRKNVRRPRNAPPGTVTLKRFASIRVRPGLPGSVR